MTPNHALQRTAPRVTVAADSGLGVFTPSHLCPTSAAPFCAPPSQLPRHAPPSLSLGSLGDFAHLLRVMNAQQDIPSPVPSSKLHGLKTSSFESIASRTFWPSIARVDSAAGVFEITRRESTASPKASSPGVSREAHTPRRSNAQQLRASRQRGAYWLSSVACVSPSPSFPDIQAWASIASPGVAPGTLFGRLS